MKTIIFISFFILLFLPAFAQKPITGDKQVVMGIQGSNAGYLMLKSYYKNNMARRYAFGGSEINYFNSPAVASDGYSTKRNSLSVNSFISYGIQKIFDGFEKIEPYIGIDYVLDCYIYKSYYKREVVDASLTSSASTNGDYTLYNYSGPNYVSLALKPVAGFNYYIWKNFAIGIEYSIKLVYLGYSFPSISTSETQINGMHTINTYNNGSSINIGTSFANRVAITVNYCFGNKKNKKESKLDEN